MLLALENASFGFGAQRIIDGANWQIYPGQKIGLIGLNGKGKSTLFRIMDGQFQLDEGTLNKKKNLNIGFLNQDSLEFNTDKSVLEVAMMAYAELKEIEKEMRMLEEKIAAGDDSQESQDRYNELLVSYQEKDGYDYQYKCEIVLEGLGFKTDELQRPYKEFSGGWRMRVLLAQMILMKPELMLLDEPTNHLDLPAIEWLEKYIKNYQGTLIIISHDKDFLDAMCTELVELENYTLKSFQGTFDELQADKVLQREQQEKEYKNQQKFIAQQEKFVERFKAKNTKASQAQSIQKRLDKLDRIELDPSLNPEMKLRFEIGRKPGKIIQELEGVSKAYGEKVIFKDTKISINRGDKIGLVGANGLGKTTLLRMIDGVEDYDGNIINGHHVDKIIYAQHQVESLHLENEILAELATANSTKTEKELRQLLGCFLFSGDDVFKKIKVLSGGEKSRVALAKILLSSANFLLLDEPTNHLDMISKNILAQALTNYEGSFIMVSHDRDFIRQTANKIWEIKDYGIKEFLGTYKEWHEYKNRRDQANKEVQKEVKAKAKKENSAKLDQQKHKELKKLKNQLASSESKLKEATKKEAELLLALGDPETYKDQAKWSKLETEHKKCLEEKNALEQKCEEILEALILAEE